MMSKAVLLRELVRDSLDEDEVESTIDEHGNLMVAEKDLPVLNTTVKRIHRLMFE